MLEELYKFFKIFIAYYASIIWVYFVVVMVGRGIVFTIEEYKKSSKRKGEKDV